MPDSTPAPLTSPPCHHSRPAQTRDVNTLTKTARGILRGIQAKAITNKLILGESAGEVAMKAGARTARGCQGSGLSPHRGGA